MSCTTCRPDPLEQANIAREKPDIVASLLQGYEAWFPRRPIDSVLHASSNPPGITRRGPVTLTRQDWRGPETAWEPGEMGGWDVDVLHPGKFDIELVFVQGPPGAAHFDLAGTSAQAEIGPGSRTCRIENVELPTGPARLRAWIERPNGAGGRLSGDSASTQGIEELNRQDAKEDREKEKERSSKDNI